MKIKEIVTTIPSFLVTAVVALPVLACPACLPLYAGFLSAIGLNFIDYTPYIKPTVIFLLLLSLIPLFWKAETRNGYGPFILGLFSSAVIIIGKFYLEEDIIFYSGTALLIIASIWNIKRKDKNSSSCNLCKE